MTEPLGPPPIEPLSDIEWSRVERGLWARLEGAAPADAPATRRGLPRWIWLAAPALAAAAIALVVIARDGDGTGTPGDPARVVTNESASSIAFGDAHVTLDPHSAVVMERDGTNALLERGAAWFAVAPRKDRPPFVVRAGDTKIRVIGTRFRVGHFAEVVAVEVEHGIVEIQHHETVIELRAGQRWSSADGVRTAMVDDVKPDVVKPDDAKPDDAKPDLPPDVAPVMTGKTKSRPVKKLVKPTVKQEPKPAPKPEVKLDPRAKFERMSAIEARDPAAAITGYLELANGGNATWAELSLFAAGRLAHDRGDPRAKSLLDRYLARYPRGANADDARELRASVRK